MAGLIIILLVLSLSLSEELSFKTHLISGSVEVRDEELAMSWIKLREGGYMVSAKIPESLGYEGFVCTHLTDLGAKEIRDLIVKNRSLPGKLPVRSLNAFVRINKKPHLAFPELYYINPTAGKYEEVASVLARKTLTAIKRDPGLMERFREYVGEFEKRGLDPVEARREALKLIMASAGIRVSMWLPKEDLPRKLYLYCHRTTYRHDPGTGRRRGISEVRLYPVTLSVVAEGNIRIEKVEVLESDIRLVIRVAYPGRIPRNLPLDLITVNPPVAEGFSFKGYRFVYAGGYLYQGSGRDPNRGSYVVMLSNAGKGFYTIISHQGEERTYELYIRLGYYGSKVKRKEISLWNPHPGDSYYTGTLIDEGYSHRKLLKLLGIKTPAKLTFRIVSPEGYESELFEVEIK